MLLHIFYISYYLVFVKNLLDFHSGQHLQVLYNISTAESVVNVSTELY